jgi:transposase-like protein
MPQGCSICQRWDSRAINEALTRGEPVRALARRYGIPKTTLMRHASHAQRPPSTESPPMERPMVERPVELGDAFEAEHAALRAELARTQAQLARIHREFAAWRTAQDAQRAHYAADQALVAQLRACLGILHDDAPSWQLVHSLLRGDGRNGKGPLLQALRRLVGRPERSFYGME